MSKTIVGFNLNEWIELDQSGPGRTLGFVKFTVLDGDGDETTFKNLKVRLNPKGEPSLMSPTQPYKNRDGDPRGSADYGWCDALYARYVSAIFSREEIVAVLAKSEALASAAKVSVAV